MIALNRYSCQKNVSANVHETLRSKYKKIFTNINTTKINPSGESRDFNDSIFTSQGQINYANLAMTGSHMPNKWTQLGSSHENHTHTHTLVMDQASFQNQGRLSHFFKVQHNRYTRSKPNDPYPQIICPTKFEYCLSSPDSFQRHLH